MKATILAGGIGSRFRPLTFTKPKPMIPLLNKPIIEHIVEYLRTYNIRDIAITTNYRRDQIMAHMGTGDRFGVRLSYPVEETQLGTAGCVKNIENYFDGTFVVIQGDNITDMDLKQLIAFHERNAGLCTIATKAVTDPSEYGVVGFDDSGLVHDFIEKPGSGSEHNLINTGIYILEPEALKYIPKGEFFDFSRNLFPILLEKEMIYALRMGGFWSDVGKTTGYKSAQTWMLEKITDNFIDVPHCEIVNAVQIGNNVTIGKDSTIIGPVVIGDNCVIEENCIIGPNTTVGDNTLLKSGSCMLGSVLFENVRVGVKSHMEGCYVAEDTNIGYNNTIQSNSLIGSNCMLGRNVDVSKNSRIWPDMEISAGTKIKGTFKKFRQVHFVREDRLWKLRDVSPDEAFYFNRCEHSNMRFTGHKATSLKGFMDNLKVVDMSSINHHLRYNINDFSVWLRKVICDAKLADDLEAIKKEVGVGSSNDILKKRLIDRISERLYGLISYPSV